MNDIQVGRYSALLHKLLDMSEGAPAPTLAPELFAMLALEVDRPEWEFLRGGKLCQGYVNEAASVGARSMAALLNPTGSGVLTVVKEISALYEGDYIIMTQNLGTGNDLSLFDNDGFERIVDFRYGVNDLGYNAQPGCRILSDQNALKGGAYYRIYAVAYSATNRFFHDTNPIVLPPNTAIIICTAADNKALYASFTWVERTIEKMELQGVNPRIV